MPKKKVDGIDPLEKRILSVLEDALRREECAARAAARIDYQLLTMQEEKREPPSENIAEVAEDTAQTSSHEFNIAQFQQLFSQLNVMRLSMDLIELVDLQDKEPEITGLLIHDIFGGRAGPPGKHAPASEMLIGSDKEILLEQLRRKKAREQKQKS